MTKDHLTAYSHKKNGLISHSEETNLDDLLSKNIAIPPSPSTASIDNAPSSPQAALTNGSSPPDIPRETSPSQKRRLSLPTAKPQKRKYQHLFSQHNLKEFSVQSLYTLDALEKECTRQGLKMCMVDNMEPEGNDRYEVEDIVEMKIQGGCTFYLVKWKNWPSVFNTWEDYNNIKACHYIFNRFMNRPYAKCHLKHPQDSASLIRTLLWMTQQDFSDPLPLLLVLDRPVDTLKSYPYKLGSIKKALSNVLATNCVLEKTLKLSKKFGNVKKFIDFVNQRQETLQNLEVWKKDKLEHFAIDVENLVDLEVPPVNFEFIADYRAGDGIVIPNDPLVGCECTDCFSSKSTCCPSKSGAHFPFTKTGAIHITPGFPIYECNTLCNCGPDCKNRITQNGTKVRLCIFRTSNGKGWGVKTLEKIRKDMFVMEYMGEIILSEEAEQRGRSYDDKGSTYLFDLDFEAENNAFTVDATFMGNASHFVNHSCSPNMTVYAVWVNNLDSRMPRIAFFSNRTIPAGEELTFDYTMNMQRQNRRHMEQSLNNSDLSSQNFMVCKCGASGCRKFIFT